MGRARVILAATTAMLACACGLIVGLKDREPYDASTDADADCDANFQGDDKNCGRCGHSCLGGACTSGTCQPAQVAATLDGGVVRSIAVDDANIYFGSAVGSLDGVIEMCPMSGCTAGKVLAPSLPASPRSMAVAGGMVYWTEVVTAGPESVSIDGGPVQTLESGNVPTQLLVDNGHLYWADVSSPDTSVRTCTPPQCGSSYDTNVTPPLPNGSTAIAIRGSTLYVSQEYTSSLQLCTLPNCLTWTDVAPGKQANSVAADDDFVYFTDLGTTVWSCPAKGSCGSTPSAVSTGETTASTLLIDGTNLYWIDVGNALRVCKLPGPCTSANSIRYPGNVHGLAFDAFGIYYGNGPSVMRVAKP